MPYEADYQLLAIIASSANLHDLADALLPVAHILECKDFSLVLNCQRPLVPDLFYAFSSNAQWAQIYLQNDLHKEDPILHKSLDQPLAFIWTHDHQPQIESQFWSIQNSRLDEIQAAVLRVKLNYLDQENNIRRKIANSYLENIKNSKLILPSKPKN